MRNDEKKMKINESEHTKKKIRTKEKLLCNEYK